MNKLISTIACALIGAAAGVYGATLHNPILNPWEKIGLFLLSSFITVSIYYFILEKRNARSRKTNQGQTGSTPRKTRRPY